MEIAELLRFGMNAEEAGDFLGSVNALMSGAAGGDASDIEVALRRMEVGITATKLGWFDEAKVLFDSAEPVIDEYRDPFMQVEFAFNYGLMLHNWGHNHGAKSCHQDAIGWYDKATAVESLGSHGRIVRAHANFNRANVDLCLGNWDKAVAGWDAAHKTYKEAGETQYFPDVARAKGHGQLDQGFYDDALGTLVDAAVGFTEADRNMDLWITHRLMAHALFHEGEFESAATMFRSCANFFEDARDMYLYFGCLVDLSVTLTAQGKDGAPVMERARRFMEEMSQELGAEELASMEDEMKETLVDHVHPKT